MDHSQVRYPTNVEDIARVLYDLSHLPNPLPPILHYASPAPSLTKYDMTVIIGKVLELPIDHIAANTEKPAPGSGTQRPENTELSMKKLEEIGVDVSEAQSFEEWWSVYAKDIKKEQKVRR